MVSFWFDFIKYFETFPKLNTKLSVYDAWVSDSESILMTSPGLNTFSTFCRWRLMTEISWRGSWHHQPSLLSTALILVAVRFRICDFAMYYKLLTNLRCFFLEEKMLELNYCRDETFDLNLQHLGLRLIVYLNHWLQ